MIEVEININPWGQDIGVKTVSKLFVANIGQSHFDGYNYVYCIYEGASPFAEEVLKHGTILNHNRMNPCYKLIAKVLADDGVTCTESSEDFVNKLKERNKL